MPPFVACSLEVSRALLPRSLIKGESSSEEELLKPYTASSTRKEFSIKCLKLRAGTKENKNRMGVSERGGGLKQGRKKTVAGRALPTPCSGASDGADLERGPGLAPAEQKGTGAPGESSRALDMHCADF